MPPTSSPPPVGSILTARHAFVARSEDELSFSRQDKIQVLETDENFNDSWFLGKHLGTGQTGLFPQTYMEATITLPPVEAKLPQETSTASKPNPALLHQGDAPPSSDQTDSSFRSSQTRSHHSAAGASQNSQSRYRISRHTQDSTQSQPLQDGNPQQLPYPTTSAFDSSKITSPISMPDIPPASPVASPTQMFHSASAQANSSLNSSRHPSAFPSPIDLSSKNHYPYSQAAGLSPSYTSSHPGSSLASPVEPVSPLRPASHPNESRTPSKPRLSGGRAATTAPSAKHSSLGATPSNPVRSPEANSAVHRTIQDIDFHLTSLRRPPNSDSQTSSTQLPSTTIRRSNSVSSSDYGSDGGNPPASYIHGAETDDEEAEAEDEFTDIPPTDDHSLLTRDIVAEWTPNQVADHLRSLQIPLEACEEFRQQEISGDVLLSLDRDTLLHPTLFDLGVAGTRLKIWNKIREFREELDSVGFHISPSYRPDNSALEPTRAVDDSYLRLSQDLSSLEFAPPQRPLSGSFAFPSSSAPVKSRRHSRLSASSSSNNFHVGASSLPVTPGHHSHSREPTHSTVYNRHSSYGSPSTGNLVAGLSNGHHRRKSSAYAGLSHRHGSMEVSSSGNSQFHSRVRAITNPPASRPSDGSVTLDSLNSYTAPMTRTDTMASSVYDVDLTDVPQPSSAGPFENSGMPLKNGGSLPEQSLSHNTNLPAAVPAAHSLVPLNNPTPVVTNLDDNASSSMTSSLQSPRSSENSTGWHLRIPGFRAFSDSTADKKTTTGIRKPTSVSQRKGEVSLAGVGGVGVMDDSKSASKSSLSGNMSTKPTSILPRRQNKKGTSAFVHGLVDKTPAEQMEGCDFSGWMMKRSTKLIGNWKSRLFVLRGRRLSYYYSESDTCEKGLIDISNHQVLPATHERLVGFHASISQIPSSHSRNVSGGGGPEASGDGAGDSKGGDGLFVFKLVPPRFGFTKTVNFTKPMVHYFAVSNVDTGRAWMAALMKANIELVESSVYSTFNHRTISLKQAQAMNMAPPVLEPAQDLNSAAWNRRLGQKKSKVMSLSMEKEDNLPGHPAKHRASGPGRTPGPDGMVGSDEMAARSGSAASSKVDSAASGVGTGSTLLREKGSKADSERQSFVPVVSAL